MNTSHQANNNLHEPSITAAVSVSGVAKMLKISRARFYQLVKEGIFPAPVYDVRTLAVHSIRMFSREFALKSES